LDLTKGLEVCGNGGALPQQKKGGGKREESIPFTGGSDGHMKRKRESPESHVRKASLWDKTPPRSKPKCKAHEIGGGSSVLGDERARGYVFSQGRNRVRVIKFTTGAAEKGESLKQKGGGY